MKLFVVLLVTVFLVSELLARPSALQGFGGGDQTTGSKWPPYEGAGQDYWSLKAGNIDLSEHNVNDGKDIVKKETEEDKSENSSPQQDAQAQNKPLPPTLPNPPSYPTNRRLHTVLGTRRFFLRNPYVQVPL